MTREELCPYCVTAGFGFRLMIRNTQNEYVCPGCGHVSSGDGSEFRCSCDRCRVGNLRTGALESKTNRESKTTADTELLFNITESAELLRRVFPHYPELNDVQTVPNLEGFFGSISPWGS